MAITSGVAPHNGWVEINGSRFQVVSGLCSFNSLNSINEINAKIPLTPYFNQIVGLTGYNTVKCKAIVLTHGSEWTLNPQGFFVKSITFNLTNTWIQIYCHDPFTAMESQRTTDTWTNKKGHEIAQDLVGRLGLSFSSTPSKVMAGRKIGKEFVKLTDNVTYLHAIHKLAEMDGKRVYADENGTVNYKEPGTGSTYSVMWRKPTPQQPMVSDCLNLSVIHNLDASGTQSAKIPSWKPDKKQTNTGTYTIPGTGETRQLYSDPDNLEMDQAQQKALADAERDASHEWEISATVVGDPSVKVDGKVQLTGTGSALDQSYPIDSVVHNFGYNGYTTTINAKTKGQGREGG
jgi:hypothetical protein